MRSRRLVVLALSLSACGSSSSKVTIPKTDFAMSGTMFDLSGDQATQQITDGMGGGLGDLPIVTGSNTVTFVVDAGPTGAMYSSYNVPYVSVTICAVGSTSNCATIDHVSLDTGSTGLRILASEMPTTLLSALPITQDGTMHDLGECYAYADGYVWGSVRTADFTLGSEKVGGLPLMIIGDPALGTVPAQCKKNGSSEDTLDTFGAKGIIGIGTEPLDCGDYCVTPTVKEMADPTYPYFSCPTAATCTPIALADAAQVPNPVALFTTDNNGVILQTPDPAVTGGANVMGTLIFGIGTETNNALGTAKILKLDDTGSFTTQFNSQSMASSFFDSGSTDLLFVDSSLTECGKGNFQYRFCPATTTSLDAKVTDGTTTIDAPFRIANASTILGANGNTAFDDLGYDGMDSTSFDWGLPFFFGRRMFTAIDGASTPGGMGPYYAY